MKMIQRKSIFSGLVVFGILASVLLPGLAFAVAPVANDGSASTLRNTPKEITLTASDADGDNLTFAIVNSPDQGGTLGAIGSVTKDGNDSSAPVTYTPAADFSGTETFTFNVTDEESSPLTSNTATITVRVGGTAPPQGLPTEGEVPTTGEGLLDMIGLIGNWVFAIFLAISLIYIILAAFQFVTGGSDPTKVSEARQKLIFAAVGIAIALLAAGFDDILRNILVG